jgi:hypothetical protein
MAIRFLPPPEARPNETWTHVYRVCFWRQQSPPPESAVPPGDAAWSAEIWDLSAEDVHEVIQWADEKAEPEQIYTLYIKLEDGHQPGEPLLIQIAGADPTRNPPFADDFRRKHPVR